VFANLQGKVRIYFPRELRPIVTTSRFGDRINAYTSLSAHFSRKNLNLSRAYAPDHFIQESQLARGRT
jgi:hypothetical protein